MRRGLAVFVTVSAICFGIYSTVLADAAHIYTGGYPASVVQSLKYVLSGGDSGYQQNVMQRGADMWNDISSAVSLSLNSVGARMSIIKSTSDQAGRYGACFWYKKNILGQIVPATSTDIWYCTDCYIYDNQCQYMDEFEKSSVMGHEVGHGLSLAHTNDLGTSEIMDSGSWPDEYAPTPVDEGHLTLKWGY